MLIIMKKLTMLFSIIIFISINANAQSKLKIFGGKNYDQFLGCMTCDDDEPNSIWSPLNDYGSTHKAMSIWNKNGVYGSKKSNYSPY